MEAKRTSLAVGTMALSVLVLSGCGVVAFTDAQRAQGGFDRTLAVSGSVDLDIQSGSGGIEVRTGNAGEVRVVGRITASDWRPGGGGLSLEERVRRLETDPPVEQNGSRIRIGRIEDEDLQRNVSISYTLTVPAETTLVARTGSGSVEITGVRRTVEVHAGSGSIDIRDVGGNLTVETGSGSITAEGVGGSFDARTGSGSINGLGVTGAIAVHTGSGSIEVTQTGRGDVDASTGSGSIELSGIRGAVQASTSSGRVRVRGEQTGEWRLSSSSGGVEVELAGEPAFQLDAESRSGRIDTDLPVTVTGRVDRRSLRGAVNGGGPLLHIRTGSGSIRIR